MNRFLGHAAIVALLFGNAAAAVAQTTLTVSSWLPPSHPITKDLLLDWASTVEKASQGRIRFQMLPKHPSAPPGTNDAVRNGLVDVSFTVANYLPGRFVLTQLPELLGGGETAETNSVAYSRVHWKHLHAAGEYRDVKLLAVWTHGPGQIFNTVRPITKASDIQGLRIRVGGGVQEQMARALGASPFAKPPTEIYELLSSGVADGAFFPLESLPGFRIDKVITYATVFPGGFYSASFAMFMNKDKWDKLSKQDQDLIMAQSGEGLSRRAGIVHDLHDQAGLAALKGNGATITQASPAFIKEVQAKSVAIEQDWIKAAKAKGIDGEKVLVEFRAELAKVAAQK